MLSVHDSEPYVVQALRAGAAGYVLKRNAATELAAAIRAAHDGQAYLHPSIARRVIDDYLSRIPASEDAVSEPHERLTPREREVLQLAAEGHSTRAIAGLPVPEHQDGRAPSRQPDDQARPARPDGAGQIRDPLGARSNQPETAKCVLDCQSRGSPAGPPPPVAAALASSLRAPSRGDPPGLRRDRSRYSERGKCAAPTDHDTALARGSESTPAVAHVGAPERPGACDVLKRGVAAGRSAQRACERSSDWRRGAAGSPDPDAVRNHGLSVTSSAACRRLRKRSGSGSWRLRGGGCRSGRSLRACSGFCGSGHRPRRRSRLRAWRSRDSSGLLGVFDSDRDLSGVPPVRCRPPESRCSASVRSKLKRVRAERVGERAEFPVGRVFVRFEHQVERATQRGLGRFDSAAPSRWPPHWCARWRSATLERRRAASRLHQRAPRRVDGPNPAGERRTSGRRRQPACPAPQASAIHRRSGLGSAPTKRIPDPLPPDVARTQHTRHRSVKNAMRQRNERGWQMRRTSGSRWATPRCAEVHARGGHRAVLVVRWRQRRDCQSFRAALAVARRRRPHHAIQPARSGSPPVGPLLRGQLVVVVNETTGDRRRCLDAGAGRLRASADIPEDNTPWIAEVSVPSVSIYARPNTREPIRRTAKQGDLLRVTGVSPGIEGDTSTWWATTEGYVGLHTLQRRRLTSPRLGIARLAVPRLAAGGAGFGRRPTCARRPRRRRPSSARWCRVTGQSAGRGAG